MDFEIQESVRRITLTSGYCVAEENKAMHKKKYHKLTYIEDLDNKEER